MFTKVLLGAICTIMTVCAIHIPVKHEVHHPQPYKFGYTIKDKHGEQHREEVSDGHNVVKGSYGFTDDRGIHRHVDYVADKGGFRAHVKTNEPGTANQNPAAVKMESSAHGGVGSGIGGAGVGGIGYGIGGAGIGGAGLGGAGLGGAGYGIGGAGIGGAGLGGAGYGIGGAGIGGAGLRGAGLRGAGLGGVGYGIGGVGLGGLGYGIGGAGLGLIPAAGIGYGVGGFGLGDGLLSRYDSRYGVY